MVLVTDLCWVLWNGLRLDHMKQKLKRNELVSCILIILFFISIFWLDDQMGEAFKY